MNTFNRRDFVLGSSALGLLMASRAGLTANRHAAPVHREADRLRVDVEPEIGGRIAGAGLGIPCADELRGDRRASR